MNVNRINEKEVDHLVEEYFRYDPLAGKVFNKIKRSSKTIVNGEVKSKSKNGYYKLHFYGKNFYVHRLAWRLYYGKWPNNQIDHINNIRTDNRIVNLRAVNHRENQLNKKINKYGKLFGCFFDKRTKRYRTNIVINKKQNFIGYFKTELEAHEQYLRALKAIETRNFKSAKELRDYLKKV